MAQLRAPGALALLAALAFHTIPSCTAQIIPSPWPSPSGVGGTHSERRPTFYPESPPFVAALAPQVAYEYQTIVSNNIATRGEMETQLRSWGQRYNQQMNVNSLIAARKEFVESLKKAAIEDSKNLPTLIDKIYKVAEDPTINMEELQTQVKKALEGSSEGLSRLALAAFRASDFDEDSTGDNKGGVVSPFVGGGGGSPFVGGNGGSPFVGGGGSPFVGGNGGNSFGGTGGGSGGNPFGGNSGNGGSPFVGGAGNPTGGNSGNPSVDVNVGYPSVGGVSPTGGITGGSNFAGNGVNPSGGSVGFPFGGRNGNPSGVNVGNPYGNGGSVGVANPFQGNNNNFGSNGMSPVLIPGSAIGWMNNGNMGNPIPNGNSFIGNQGGLFATTIGPRSGSNGNSGAHGILGVSGNLGNFVSSGPTEKDIRILSPSGYYNSAK